MEFVYNKYYIIDNFGNYYRLDDQGKLVAAHSKKEATLFSYEEAFVYEDGIEAIYRC